jgi:hypothetical protein
MKNKWNKNENSKNSKLNKNKINKKTLKNKNKKKISKGGKVLASGGFGCVFTPALRCENKKN